MEESGNGRAHYDDEDPNMEGWDDIKDDSDGYEDIDFSAMDGIDGNGVENELMDDDDDNNDDESDDGFAEVFGDSSGADEEIDEDEIPIITKSKKSKKNESSFADASEYEDLINQSYAKSKKRKDSSNENDYVVDGVNDLKSDIVPSKHRNKSSKKTRKS